MVSKHEIKMIHNLVAIGGPEPSQYPMLHDWFTHTMQRYRLGEITKKDIDALWEAFGEAFTPATILGFVVRKPHGYHGDFELIDRIYTKWISPDPKLARWDHFFHSCAGPKAVLNRKTFLHSVLKGMRPYETNGHSKVLSVGCGPARDIAEYLSSGINPGFHFTCLDQDANAIAHAKALCRQWLDHVAFEKTNVIRHLPAETFDLVWAGGLFDYFSDRVFVFMLGQLIKRVGRGGRLIVGNFSTENPDRDIMDFGGWRLHYRTPTDLLALAARAGFPEPACTVRSEPLGINLFLEVRQ